MNRVAAIDCGTNSIRLLIAEVGADGSLSDVDRRMQIVRLGQGVDATGELSEQALQRTAAAMQEYQRAITEAGCDAVRMVATSASRDASNGLKFTTMVQSILGQLPEVISGEQEAQLSYAGATSDAATEDGLSEDGLPFLVVDIGGGSTELVAGAEPSPDPGASAASGNVSAYSMNIGSVRITERSLHEDPPTAQQRAAAVADIEAAMDTAAQHIDLADDYTVVGVAGTLTTLAALDLGLDTYDPAAVHGHVLSRRSVEELSERLLGMAAEQRSRYSAIHPGRVDVIGAGSLIAAVVMQRLGCDFLQVSERDILDGIAASLVAGTGAL